MLQFSKSRIEGLTLSLVLIASKGNSVSRFTPTILFFHHSSVVWDCSPKHFLGCHYPLVGSGMFIQELSFSKQKKTFFILPLHWKILLEYNKTWTR